VPNRLAPESSEARQSTEAKPEKARRGVANGPIARLLIVEGRLIVALGIAVAGLVLTATVGAVAIIVPTVTMLFAAGMGRGHRQGER
jgi:hypothetical protein